MRRLVEIYLDPSYRSTGITIVQKGESPSVSFMVVSTSSEGMRSYPKYFARAREVVQRVVRELGSLLPGAEVIVESPPSNGFTAAGLYGLSFLLMSTLKDCGVRKAVHFSASNVKRFCEKRGLKDQKRRGDLAIQYLRVLNNNVPMLRVSGLELLQDKHQNDAATAFLFYVMRKVGYGTFETVWEDK